MAVKLRPDPQVSYIAIVIADIAAIAIHISACYIAIASYIVILNYIFVLAIAIVAKAASYIAI